MSHRPELVWSAIPPGGLDHRPADVPPRSLPLRGVCRPPQTTPKLARKLAPAMSKTRTSRPIEGDTALIDKHGQPGGETIEATVEPEDMTFADWCDEAEPYYIDRASKPGTFTSWSAIKDAPDRIRKPRSPNWPGMYMHRFHDRGYVEYALDKHGHEMFTPSEKPETGGSIVRVWVGVEAGRKAAAA